MSGIGTRLLLLEAVTLACRVLLYVDCGTRLGTKADTQPTLGEDDRDLPGHPGGGDTAVGHSVATSSTLIGQDKLRGHLQQQSVEEMFSILTNKNSVLIKEDS